MPNPPVRVHTASHVRNCPIVYDAQIHFRGRIMTMTAAAARGMARSFITHIAYDALSLLTHWQLFFII